MKGLENKTVFAKVVMIIAAVVAVIEFIVSSVSMYKVYHPIDLIDFFERYYPNKIEGIILMTLMIINIVFPLVITLFWVLFIAVGKENFKVPVIVTFVYVSFRLLRGCYLSFRANCGLIQLIRENIIQVLIFTAWLMLLIGVGQVHRLVFTILRGIVIAYHLFGDIRWEYRNVKEMTVGNLYLAEHAWFLIGILELFFMVVFVLWIFKPELFEKKTESKGM